MDENDGAGPHNANSSELFSWAQRKRRAFGIMRGDGLVNSLVERVQGQRR
jgi:hypothetical protein